MNRQMKSILAIVGFIAVSLSVFLFTRYPLVFEWDLLFFILFMIISESLVIVAPNKVIVSLGFGIVLPVGILFGPPSAILCAALGSLLSVFKADGEYKHVFNIAPFKTVANLSNYIISAGLSSFIYTIINGGIGIQSVYNSMLLMLLAALVFIVTNIIITGNFIIALNDYDAMEVWKENFSGLIPNVLGVSAVSIIITLAYMNFGVAAIVILFFPYLLIRYSFQLVFDMRQAYLNTIKALSSALEEKDPYTKGHSERVEKYSALLAKEVEYVVDTQQLEYAAIFHDIGKIGIYDTILNKPGRLTDEEFELIKQHPVKGMNILGNVGFLKKATQIIGAHHEYLDGTGYPNGLKGYEIPMESKIITVVDIYDAVTTDRPYRKAMTEEEAINILRKESGTKLDPVLVDAFIKLHSEGRLEK